MSTGINISQSAFRDRWTLEQDDEAGFLWWHDTSGAWHSPTANSSFEEATWSEYWGRQSVPSFTRGSGGVDGTPYYGILGGSSNSTAIFSTTRIGPTGTLDWARARANYRRSFSTDSGSVKVVAAYRSVNYPGSSCNSGWGGDPCVWAGTDRSAPSVGSFGTYWYPTYCTVSGSWNYCTTSGSNPPSWEALDARVVVYNRMFKESGARSSVGLDRTRVMADD